MAHNSSESPYWATIFKGYRYFYGLCYPVFTLVSLGGCLSLLIVMITRRKQIRYPATTSWAICWLLLADIGYLISRFVIYLGVTKIFPRRLINLSEEVCWWWVITFGSLAVMQGYVQAIISIERLLAVRCPLKVKLWVTPRRLFLALGLVSVYSVGMSAGYVAIGYYYNEEKQECVLNTRHGFELALYVFLAWTAPPCVILTVCTIGIIAKLVVRSRSKLRNIQKDRRQLSSSEIRLSLMLVAMDVVFVTTSLPLSVVYFALNASGFSTRMMFAWRVSLFLTSLGTYTDWIIVLMLGAQVRKAFRAACCCCCCRPASKAVSGTGVSGSTHSSSTPLEQLSRHTILQGK